MSKSALAAIGAVICLVLMLPSELNARGGGSQGGHNGVTVSKSTDKSSPNMIGQTTSHKTTPHATAHAAKKKGQTSKNTTQTSKDKGAIEIQDYGFGVSMPASAR